MKVVHIFWGLTFGGIETMLVNIVNEQVKHGIDLSIIIINDMYEQSLIDSVNRDIKVYLLHRKRRFFNPMFIFRLNRILYKQEFDVIHLHSSRLFSIICGYKLRKKLCVTLHDLPKGKICCCGILGRIFPIINILMYGNTSCIDRIPKVFAISRVVHEELLLYYRVESIVICNGIQPDKFAIRSNILPSRILRIVQVSRLDYDKKGQDLLIQAVALLRGYVQVDFIGEGVGLDYLMRLASDLKVEQYVTFLGKQTQKYIAEHLKNYDLFIQPSRCEGFGLTVAEAMAACVPVLVSAGQGPAEVTCGESYGWTFENGNVDDLVQRIDYIRNHYEEALKKCVSARQYVANNYDVKVTVGKYLDYYGVK